MKSPINYRKRRFLFLLAFFGIIGLSIGIARLLTLDHLVMKHVHIKSPFKFVDKPSIYRLANGYKHQSMIWIFCSGKLKKQLRSVMGVASVRLWIRIPNTLIITLKEKSPYVLFVHHKQGILVDQTGDVIKKYPDILLDPMTNQIIQVRGISPLWLKQPSIHPTIMARVAHILGNWTLHFKTPLQAIQFNHLFLGVSPQYDDVSLPTTFGMINIGNGVQLNNQLSRFKRFLDHWQEASKNRQLTGIDLRLSGKVIVR